MAYDLLIVLGILASIPLLWTAIWFVHIWYTNGGSQMTDREYFNGNPDATQKNCKYGYVLPDRCRYMAHKGCACGEYPPLKWNADKGQYENDQQRA